MLMQPSLPSQVFMNHLDVGYNGIPETGFVYNVLNTYFDQYFPLAIETANVMRDFGFHCIHSDLLSLHHTVIYTSHPWLISMYLDCPIGMNLHCPDQNALNAFTSAVKRGDIVFILCSSLSYRYLYDHLKY